MLKEGFTKARLRQYFAAFGCLLSCFMLGACFVWFTPLMVKLLDPKPDQELNIPMTKEESSWMIAIIEIGELLSPIPAGILVDKIGRKPLLVSSFPLTLASWIILLATNSVEALYAVRFIQGIAVGIVFTVSPIYLAEIAEPDIRGMICGHFQSMWTLGNVYAFSIGPFLSYNNYAYACGALCLVFLAVFVWAPESPYYLLIVDNLEGARKSLSWLRGTDNVDEEFNTLKNSIQTEMSQGKASVRDLYNTPKARRSFIVVSSVCFVKYMSGMPGIMAYLSDTINRGAGDLMNPDHVTIMVGVVITLSTILSAQICDVFGRRPLVLLSISGSILFNAVASVYYYLEHIGTPNIGDYAWVAYASLTAYCVLNSIGLGPLLQTLQGECFSSKTRGIGGAVVTFQGTIYTFISLKQYQTVTTYFGVYMNYVSFCVFSLVGSISLWSMKETAGKSLAEIQRRESQLKEARKSLQSQMNMSMS